jgi:hypothetical protein
MSSTIDNVTTNCFVCDSCGKTNWYSANVDDGICGGCDAEGSRSGSAGQFGAGGVIQLNTHHECRRSGLMIDVSLICAVLLVVVLGSTGAILKNKKRKS